MQVLKHVHWSGSPFPTQRILPALSNVSPAWQADSSPMRHSEHPYYPSLVSAWPSTHHSTFPSVALLSRPTVKHSYLHKLHAEDFRKPHCRLTSTSTHHPSPGPICCTSVPTTLLFCGEHHRRQNSQGRTLEAIFVLLPPSYPSPISYQTPKSVSMKYLQNWPQGLPGSPGVTVPCLHRRGHGLNPWSRN